MKHTAKDDDEQDTSNEDNANDMKKQWFDIAFCKKCSTNLGHDYSRTWVSKQCDSIWAGGHNGKCAPESSKKNVFKLLMSPNLNLDHGQRARQALSLIHI